MAKVSFASMESAPVVASPAGASGKVETRALFARDRDPIHLHLHRLAPGARLRVRGAPTDRLLYVWQGEVEAKGAPLKPRSSAIVEYGAALDVTAGADGAAMLEFHMKERGATDRAGGHVHLLPSDRVPHTVAGEGKRAGMYLHADSQCSSCSLWLHENDYISPDIETELHYHSEDEVMFVRAGSIRIGNKVYGPGTALFVAANTKYGFFSGPDGLSFVNFRGTSPTYTKADGSVVMDEAKLWNDHVGRPKYIEPAHA